MSKFTIQSIKEKAKYMDEVLELELKDGIKVKYYPRFSNSRVGELVQDLILLVKYVEENMKEQYPNLDLKLNQIVNFLAVKHFTELKSELEGIEYDEQLLLMEDLSKTSWFGEILIAFEDGELEKVSTAVTNSVIILNRLDELKVGKKPNGKKK